MYVGIKEKFAMLNQRAIAENVGTTPATLCTIKNAKQKTTKTTAYCIVKSIHSEATIDEYFNKIEKKGE